MPRLCSVCRCSLADGHSPRYVPCQVSQLADGRLAALTAALGQQTTRHPAAHSVYPAPAPPAPVEITIASCLKKIPVIHGGILPYVEKKTCHSQHLVANGKLPHALPVHRLMASDVLSLRHYCILAASFMHIPLFGGGSPLSSYRAGGGILTVSWGNFPQTPL